MSKNEQPSNENCYFLGAHLGFREALGRHWGGQGGHGLVLGLLWVSLAVLGGPWATLRFLGLLWRLLDLKNDENLERVRALFGVLYKKVRAAHCSIDTKLDQAIESCKPDSCKKRNPKMPPKKTQNPLSESRQNGIPKTLQLNLSTYARFANSGSKS